MWFTDGILIRKVKLWKLSCSPEKWRWLLKLGHVINELATFSHSLFYYSIVNLMLYMLRSSLNTYLAQIYSRRLLFLL